MSGRGGNLAIGLAAAIGAVAIAPADASERFAARLGIEPRLYFQQARFGDQPAGRVGGSVSGDLQWSWRDPSGERQARLDAFARLSDPAEGRTHWDLREFYWRTSRRGASQLLVGINKVFWGVTESVHLVDVVNQADLREAVDGEEKLGQPMVSLTLPVADGSLALYGLVGFRPREFPRLPGRLRPLGDAPLAGESYGRDGGRDALDFAARYSGYRGNLDFALSYFDGTAREPSLLPAPGGEGLIAHYPALRQAGLELQYTEGPALFKLEALNRRIGGVGRTALVGGIEYTLYGVAGGAGDLGLLGEYVRDRRPEGWPETPFEDDWFVGLRWTANDAADTTLLFGVLADRGDDRRVWSLEATTRIGKRTTISLEAKRFDGFGGGTPLAGIGSDDYAELSLSFYF